MPEGFGPGDRVPVTGIYTANHDLHRESHEVFATEGESFPVCQACGKSVNFLLSHAAGHIHEDESFRHSDSIEDSKKQGKKQEGDG